MFSVHSTTRYTRAGFLSTTASRKDSGHPAYINIRSVPIHHGQIGETVLPQSKGSPTIGQYYQEKPDRLGATPQEKGQTLFGHFRDTSDSDDPE